MHIISPLFYVLYWVWLSHNKWRSNTLSFSVAKQRINSILLFEKIEATRIDTREAFVWCFGDHGPWSTKLHQVSNKHYKNPEEDGAKPNFFTFRMVTWQWWPYFCTVYMITVFVIFMLYHFSPYKVMAMFTNSLTYYSFKLETFALYHLYLLHQINNNTLLKLIISLSPNYVVQADTLPINI